MQPDYILYYIPFLTLWHLTVSNSIHGPNERRGSRIHTRDKGTYICSGPKWSGTCNHVIPTGDTCRPIPFLESLQVSLGPDRGVTCTVFEQCEGDHKAHLILTYPGNAELDVHLVSYYSWYKCILD